MPIINASNFSAVKKNVLFIQVLPQTFHTLSNTYFKLMWHTDPLQIFYFCLNYYWLLLLVKRTFEQLKKGFMGTNLGLSKYKIHSKDVNFH